MKLTSTRYENVDILECHRVFVLICLPTLTDKSRLSQISRIIIIIIIIVISAQSGRRKQDQGDAAQRIPNGH